MIGKVENCFTYRRIGTFTSYIDDRLQIVDMQTQHGQIEAASPTCFNLNKASVLPVQSLARSLLSLSTHEHTQTDFCPLLESHSASFSLHSVQITSRWDKSIMFPDPPPPPLCFTFLAQSSPSTFSPLEPPSFLIQKDIHISLKKEVEELGRGVGGGTGGQERKQNLCNQQQDVRRCLQPVRAHLRPPDGKYLGYKPTPGCSGPPKTSERSHNTGRRGGPRENTRISTHVGKVTKYAVEGTQISSYLSISAVISVCSY